MYKSMNLILVFMCFTICSSITSKSFAAGKLKKKNLREIFLSRVTRQVTGKPTWNYKKRVTSFQAKSHGSSVRFHCMVDGVPKPRVKWFKDGIAILQDSKYKIRNRGQVLLKTSVTSDDSGQYKCVATNRYGSIQFTYELRVQAKPDSRPVVKITRNKTVHAGDDVTLTCRVLGQPHLHVKWLRNNNETFQHFEATTSRRRNALISELNLQNVTLEDAGPYTCVVANTLGYTHKNVWLRVLQGLFSIKYSTDETGTGRMMEISANKTVHLGDDVTFTCKVFGQPHPHVQWLRKNDGTFQYFEATTTRESNALSIVLDLQNVTSEYAGPFTCLAADNLGYTHKTVWLKVVPEERSIQWTSTTSVDEGGNVELRCSIYDKTHSLFMWTKSDTNGISTKVEDSSKTAYIENMLLIRNVTSADEAQYTCITGNNFYELEHQSAWVNVVPENWYI